jgi:hypothetical protein
MSLRQRKLPQTSVFDRPAVEALFEQHGIKRTHLDTLWRELGYRGLQDLRDLAKVTKPIPFPRRAVELLADRFVMSTSNVHQVSDSGKSSSVQDNLKNEAFNDEKWAAYAR